MKWISVEDRLPEDDDWQLVWLGGEHYPRRGAYHAEKSNHLDGISEIGIG